MNDFTKEELEIIYLDMTIYAKNAMPLNESSIHLDLRNKIQTLINSYCEHEWENNYSGSIITGIYCAKCNKKLKGG